MPREAPNDRRRAHRKPRVPLRRASRLEEVAFARVQTPSVRLSCRPALEQAGCGAHGLFFLKARTPRRRNARTPCKVPRGGLMLSYAQIATIIGENYRLRERKKAVLGRA